VSVLLTAAIPAAAATRVERVMSPGGIEAWLIESHEVPLITVRFSFDGGALQEPDGKSGVAQMAAYLFNEGAGSFATDEFTRRRNRIGAHLVADTGFLHFTVHFSTPASHKDEAFELLRLAIGAPRFDDEPIARARREYTADIKATQKDPGSVASQALRRRLYGKHRMADWVIGTIEDLQNIGRDDIETYRRRVFARANLKIAVVGDIDARTLAPLLDQVFAGVPAKAELRPASEMAGTAGGCQAIEMDVPQTAVLFGALTPRLNQRQNLANSILTAILSEPLTGRLFMEVREKRGLVYSINAGYSHYTNFGVFSGSFGAAAENVPAAMAVTERELRRMVDEGPTEQEVADAKNALVGQILLGLDTSAKLAGLVLALQIDALPITYLDDVGAEIATITVQDVWNVARLLIRPDHLAVVMVGKLGQAGACEKARAVRN